MPSRDVRVRDARVFRSLQMLAVVSACCAVAASGCAGRGAAPAIPQVLGAHHDARPRQSSPISHVVILIMENRSFNYMFNGYPGAETTRHGKMHDGRYVTLQQIPLNAKGDVGHNHPDFEIEYDKGKMDGFDLDYWDPRLPPLAPYAYAPQSDVQPDWDIAGQYTLADRMFESVTTNSYPAHQYLIAGQSAYAIGLPSDPSTWGCDSRPGTSVSLLNPQGKMIKGPFPCFDYTTLGDLLDQHQLSWRYYTVSPTYTWNGYDAINHIRYGSDWTDDIVSPSTKFATDVAAGNLASVTWIVPDNRSSDHSGSGSGSGPSYVASIVNAVGESGFWNSTAIFVVWDDWGGWYDEVAPPQLDRMGLSFRVPMLVVSPWSRHGYVSHEQHEFGSILHFTETNFGLGSLGQTDVRADDLSDCFDYSQSPPPFHPISAPLSRARLKLIEATDTTPLDD